MRTSTSDPFWATADFCVTADGATQASPAAATSARDGRKRDGNAGIGGARAAGGGQRAAPNVAAAGEESSFAESSRADREARPRRFSGSFEKPPGSPLHPRRPAVPCGEL